MHIIHLGQCPAQGEHSEDASCCERHACRLGASQHQVSSATVVLSAWWVPWGSFPHIGKWKELTDLPKSGTKRQKWSPGLFAINLTELGCQETPENKKYFILSAQLAIMSHPKMLNESKSSPSSLNSNLSIF